MTEQTNSNLQQRITDLVVESMNQKTFQPEILARISDMAKEYEATERELEVTNKELAELRVDHNNSHKELVDLRGEHSNLRAGQADLAEREKKMDILELSVQYEQKRVQDHINMVGLVFRNTTLRRGMTGQAPQPGDQYGGTVPVSEDTQETAE